MFRTNIGDIDQVVRLLLAAVLLASTTIGPATPLGWLGLIPLATGLARTCPLYRLVGFSTVGHARAG